MSKATQIEFAQLVENYYQHHQYALNLNSPIFRNAGFISTASMSGSGGFVEIRCGPAEYHAEIFITTQKDQKRWDLRELMSIDNVRSWMLQNQRNTLEKPRLEAEIYCAFCLLADGLKGVAGFEWLHS